MEDKLVELGYLPCGIVMEHREPPYHSQTADQCWLKDRTAPYPTPYLKIDDERRNEHILSTNHEVEKQPIQLQLEQCKYSFS